MNMKDTFLIQQTPSAKNIYLYPNGDSGAMTLSPILGSDNYLMVDEDRKNPDTNTYVYWDDKGLPGQGSQASDMYTLQDHTTEDGIINNVIVYCRAKSHFYNPSSSATFEILLGTSDTTYKSSEATYGNDIELNNQYNTYSCNWTSNPAKQAKWTWTDIDSLLIGVNCSTPSQLYSGVNMKLVPASRADSSDNTAIGLPTIWQCVANQDTNYYALHTNSPTLINGYGSDTFYLESYDNSVTTGTIESITLSCMAKSGEGGLTKGYPYFRISTTSYPDDDSYGGASGDGSVAYGNFWADSSGWNTFSTTTLVNPSTSAEWKWHELSETTVGYYYKASVAAGYGKLSHFYASIKYSAFTNPEIRITQMYAKINYNPTATNINLNKPSSYTISHSREVKRQQYWNDTDDVYDLQRGTKVLNMNGIEYNTAISEATDVLIAVDNIWNYYKKYENKTKAWAYFDSLKKSTSSARIKKEIYKLEKKYKR